MRYSHSRKLVSAMSIVPATAEAPFQLIIYVLLNIIPSIRYFLSYSYLLLFYFIVPPIAYVLFHSKVVPIDQSNFAFFLYYYMMFFNIEIRSSLLLIIVPGIRQYYKILA